ncbi:MAG: N-acetyltransferase family protein [Candidatus Cloacimonadales bacterium]
MQQNKQFTIRAAQARDLPSLVQIYNQAILAGEKTADLDLFSLESRRSWLNEHQAQSYPILVAGLKDKVVGYASLSAYRPGRRAFRQTVEVSYYIHNEFQQRGIGSQLLASILAKATELKYETVVALLIESNLVSIKLLEKNGFQHWGYLPGIADFSGKKLAHLYYGKKL